MRSLAYLNVEAGVVSAQRKLLTIGRDGGGVRFVVGRSASADMVLDDPSVSRQHAEITRGDDGRWRVLDLRSHNGTTVNGVPVVTRELSSGDRIGVGKVVLRFVEELSGVTDAGGRDDSPDVALSVIDRLRPPRLSGEHVSAILALGRELESERDPDLRLCRLVDLPVTKELGGLWCAALRVWNHDDDADGKLGIEPICPPRLAASGADDLDIHISQTAVRAALKDGEPVLASHSAGQASRFEAELSMAPTDARRTAAVVCPLATGAGGKARDVLYVVLPAYLASMEWLMLISLTAEQLRNAEATWAARRTAEIQAAAEHEMALAHAIQSRTLPDPRTPVMLDWAARFEPCRAVAGDYVDVIPRPDGTVILVVADASGKGMQAALITAGLHAVFHTQGRSAATLPELIDAAGQYLRTFLPATSFVTLAAVLLDPRTGRGTSVNCGHPPMLAIRRGGGGDGVGAVRAIEGGDNFPLGVTGDPVEHTTFELDAGEWLVGFTDGLSELVNERGAMLGLRPLHEQLADVCHAAGEAASAGSIADMISERLDTFRGDAAPTDDRTYLIAALPRG